MEMRISAVQSTLVRLHVKALILVKCKMHQNSELSDLENGLIIEYHRNGQSLRDISMVQGTSKLGHNKWKQVLWNDESFNLYQSDDTTRIWHKPGEGLLPKFNVRTVFDGDGIVICNYSSWYGLGPLISIHDMLNSDSYSLIPNNKVLPMLLQFYGFNLIVTFKMTTPLGMLSKTITIAKSPTIVYFPMLLSQGVDQNQNVATIQTDLNARLYDVCALVDTALLRHLHSFVPPRSQA
ncbi:hypothetical protein TNCV_2237901 [Trichonephila clavipes]|nr:hypothetical protein TNCV_2237901 [Trichonephila clavipes]